MPSSEGRALRRERAQKIESGPNGAILRGCRPMSPHRVHPVRPPRRWGDAVPASRTRPHRQCGRKRPSKKSGLKKSGLKKIGPGPCFLWPLFLKKIGPGPCFLWPLFLAGNARFRTRQPSTAGAEPRAPRVDVPARNGQPRLVPYSRKKRGQNRLQGSFSRIKAQLSH